MTKWDNELLDDIARVTGRCTQLIKQNIKLLIKSGCVRSK